MALTLWLIGASVTIIFIINNLIRTAMRQKQLHRSEYFLALGVALLPVSALLVDNIETSRFDSLEQVTLLLIIPLVIIHLGLTIVELFRKQRLRQSRGILGIGIAILLSIAAISYNFISNTSQLNAVDRNIRPTPVNAVVSPCDAASGTVLFEGLDLFLDATGLTVEEFIDQFLENDLDFSIDDLVEANNSDTSDLTSDLDNLALTAVPDLLSQGCIDQQTATLILTGLGSLPVIVRTNIEEIPLLIPGAERATLAPFDVNPQQRVTVEALVAFLNQDPTATATITQTPTATITPSPTQTRTPLPTPSITPTRVRFMTATPTTTPDFADAPTCSAITGANLNLRDAPNVETSNILLTNPLGTEFQLFGPNATGTWWFGIFNETEGWVSADFITLGAACTTLEVITS